MTDIASHPRVIHQIETMIEVRWIVQVELENIVLETLILAMDDVKSFFCPPVGAAQQVYPAKVTGILLKHMLPCEPASRNVAGGEQVTH